ncbi:LA_2272 family surface repeat-containing protein [candidate division KSB1 bacterium]
MRKYVEILLILILLVTAAGTGESNAQGGEEPFQISLFNPIQLRSENAAVLYLRINLLYGKNTYVKGLDIGLVNHNTSGESLSLQHGLAGFVEADFKGWQDNWGLNIVRGEFLGLQTGFYNEINSGKAFQWGFINRSKDIRGFQLGIVNCAENMYGLQIGLINIIKSKQELPILPIVNWSF